MKLFAKSIFCSVTILMLLAGCSNKPKEVTIKVDPQAMEKLQDRLPPHMRRQPPNQEDQQAPQQQTPPAQ